MNRLFIIGAGGHGKVIADIALKIGYTDISFLDDNATGEILGFPIQGTSEDAEKWNDGATDYIIAVGNNSARKIISQRHPNLNYVALIHPDVSLGCLTKIKRGTVVMAGAVINSCARLGAHCIINSCSVVEHDCVLEDFVHMSPRTALGGTVHVGEGTHIGIGAVVRNNITICDGCIIGAGAAVVRDIEERGVYVGVPCRKVE